MQTLDIAVDDAVLMQDVDGCSDLFAVESDDMLLQPQSGHLLQGPLIAVFHEDIHLLLGRNAPPGFVTAEIKQLARDGGRKCVLPGAAPLQSIAPGWGV